MELESLKSVPSEVWGLAGVIFGAVVSIVTNVLTNRANHEQAKLQLMHGEEINGRKLKSERIEELYVLICVWESEFKEEWSIVIKVFKGELDLKQAAEKMGKINDSVRDFDRLLMLVDLYAESAESIMSSLKGELNKYYIVKERLIGKFNGSAMGSDELKEIRRSFVSVVSKFSDFRAELVGLVKGPTII